MSAAATRVWGESCPPSCFAGADRAGTISTAASARQITSTCLTISHSPLLFRGVLYVPLRKPSARTQAPGTSLPALAEFDKSLTANGSGGELALPRRSVRMMVSAPGEAEGKVSKTGISFGNFVFLGVRSNSGSRPYGDVDLYLEGEDGLQRLTDYNCTFVLKSWRLCLVNSCLPARHPVLLDVPLWWPDCRGLNRPSPRLHQLFAKVESTSRTPRFEGEL